LIQAEPILLLEASMLLRGVKGIMAGFLAAGIAILVLPTAQGSGESIAELLDRAKREDAQNKPLAALGIVKQAYDRLWANSPLFLTQALFTKESAIGYGHYDPKPDAAFNTTDSLYVYLEPAGYGFQLNGTLYRFGFVVDVAVLDDTGKERGGAKDFTNFDYVKRTANKEIELHFIVDPLKLPAGSYKLKLTVHDKVKDQSVVATLPFTMLP
jgi:hypothetical protein